MKFGFRDEPNILLIPCSMSDKTQEIIFKINRIIMAVNAIHS